MCSLAQPHSPINLPQARWGYLNQSSTTHTPQHHSTERPIQNGQRGVAGAVSLDLRKDSDTVNQKVLITYLSKFNFSPDTLRWIKSYVHGRTKCVRFQSKTSSNLSHDVGVPQGLILGPLLFSWCIRNKTCEIHARWEQRPGCSPSHQSDAPSYKVAQWLILAPKSEEKHFQCFTPNHESWS